MARTNYDAFALNSAARQMYSPFDFPDMEHQITDEDLLIFINGVSDDLLS